jgi:hypothetical protein
MLLKVSESHFHLEKGYNPSLISLPGELTLTTGITPWRKAGKKVCDS